MGPADRCYDGASLAAGFTCIGRYPFSIWNYGPPRSVVVKPAAANSTGGGGGAGDAGAQRRTLTPFNNLIGSMIITQSRRKEVQCDAQNSYAIALLTGQFSCQVRRATRATSGI